jgi:hypothetical protein
MGISVFPVPSAGGGSTYMGALGGTLTTAGGNVVSDYLSWNFGTPFAPNATYSLTFTNILGIKSGTGGNYKVALLTPTGAVAGTTTGTLGNGDEAASGNTFTITVTPTEAFSVVALGGTPGCAIYSSSGTALTVLSGTRTTTNSTSFAPVLKATTPTPARVSGADWDWQSTMSYSKACQINNTTYVIFNSGTNVGGSTASAGAPFYVYDGASNTWTAKALMQTGTNYSGISYPPCLAAGTNSSTKVVCFMGAMYNGSSYGTSNAAPGIYDIASNAWSAGATPIGNNGMGLIGSLTSDIIGYSALMNPTTGGGNFNNSICTYQISTNTHTQRATYSPSTASIVNNYNMSGVFNTVANTLTRTFALNNSNYETATWANSTNTWTREYSNRVGTTYDYISQEVLGYNGGTRNYDPVNTAVIGGQASGNANTGYMLGGVQNILISPFVAGTNATNVRPVLTRRYNTGTVGDAGETSYYGRGTGAYASKVWIISTIGTTYRASELDTSITSYPSYLS